MMVRVCSSSQVMKIEDHADTNHRESQRGNGGGLLVLLLTEERRVGISVAAVETWVLLEPLVPEQLPGPAHHLPVAQRRRVRRQHGLHRAAERAARLAAVGRLVVRRHVRGRLVRLAPAQQDAAVGAGSAVVVALLVVELGAGVGAEEREEVVGDVVGRVDARGAGEVADDGGVREEAGADGARGGGSWRGSTIGDGGADLLLLLVDEAAAVARVRDHGEGRALRHPVHELPEIHVRDEVEVAWHDGLVVLARVVAVGAAVRDERAVAAVVEEERVPGRGAGHHVGERALDVGAGREHAAAVVVGEHGDVGGREAEAGDEGVAHGEDVVDAASQLVGRAGVVAADQGSKHLLLPRLHC
ncbi:hypothetical protein PAHAL_8G020400 [Panicum hallii]|jgi:hypothetical protein|uniref:Uncharacterized protein n=1 Tax=Panicum hallii TaxID=206008 RepID=A0A2T8I7A0_9POAL|nr:hypothetical protein PAHAL_8G020400 [Panicum hallii]